MTKHMITDIIKTSVLVLILAFQIVVTAEISTMNKTLKQQNRARVENRQRPPRIQRPAFARIRNAKLQPSENASQVKTQPKVETMPIGNRQPRFQQMRPFRRGFGANRPTTNN